MAMTRFIVKIFDKEDCDFYEMFNDLSYTQMCDKMAHCLLSDDNKFAMVETYYRN